MQKQVNPINQTQENGQKPHFWLFGSFKRGNLVTFEWSNSGYMMALSSPSFSSIKICNIKSILYTKLKKMAKNLIFGYLDHSKGAIWWLLNDLTQDIWWPFRAHHLVLSKSAISSQSYTPNSRKWPKTSFLAIWIIQKGQFGDFRII